MGASTYLASHLVPTVAQNGVARITLDADGVLNLLPGKLGECLALDLVASALGAEELGLAVARVPNPVHEEVGGEEEDEGKAGVRVHGRVVVGKVDGAVAVREGHTGHVPEDEHEAPLFVEDVPGRGGSATCTNKRVQRTKKKKGSNSPRHGNHLFTLAAGIRIQEMRHEQETHLGGDVTVQLELSCGTAHGNHEENEPGHADLEEHLHVDPAKHSRVELGAHEEVVDGIASHSVLCTARNGGEVGNEGNDEAGDDGNAHQRTKLINQGVQLEDAGDVEDDASNDGGVEGPDAGAVVHELLAAEMRQRLALGVDAGEEVVEDALSGTKDPVDGPGLFVRVGAGVCELEQVLCKVQPRLVGGCTRGKHAVVVCCANPHVPHEGREADHHHHDTGSAAKVEVRAVVDLGVGALEPAINDALLLGLARLGGNGGLAIGVGRAVCVTICSAINFGAAGGDQGVFGECGRRRFGAVFACCSAACAAATRWRLYEAFGKLGFPVATVNAGSLDSQERLRLRLLLLRLLLRLSSSSFFLVFIFFCSESDGKSGEGVEGRIKRVVDRASSARKGGRTASN